MSFSDAVIAALVLAAAGWLLYRSIRRTGSCHGCAGGCARPPARDASLVRLGSGRGPDAR